MWTIDLETDGAVTTPPVPPPAGTQGYFSDSGNTIVPFWWMNMVQNEMANVVTGLSVNRGIETKSDLYITVQEYDETNPIDIDGAGDIATIRMSICEPEPNQCYVCFHGYKANLAWIKFGYGYGNGEDEPWTIYIACGVSNDEMIVYEFDPVAEGFTYDELHEYKVRRSSDLSTLEILIDSTVVATKDASFIPDNGFNIAQVRIMCDGYEDIGGVSCMCGVVDYAYMGTNSDNLFKFLMNESPYITYVIDSAINWPIIPIEGGYTADRRILLIGGDTGHELDPVDDHQVSKAIQSLVAKNTAYARCPVYYVRCADQDNFSRPDQFTESVVYMNYILPTYGGSFYYTRNVTEHEGGNQMFTGSVLLSMKLKAKKTGTFDIATAFVDDNMFVYKDDTYINRQTRVDDTSLHSMSVSVTENEEFILNLVTNDEGMEHWCASVANDFLSKYSDIIYYIPTLPEEYPVYT